MSATANMDTAASATNRPWDLEQDGEGPGDICCLRASSPRCYEHDRENWHIKNGEWVNRVETPREWS